MSSTCDQETIAALRRSNAALLAIIFVIRDLFPYSEEMVVSGAISDPNCVPDFVRDQIERLRRGSSSN